MTVPVCSERYSLDQGKTSAMAVAQKLSNYHGLDLISLATEYLQSDPKTALHHLKKIEESVPVLLTQLKEYEKAREEQRDKLLEEEIKVTKQIGAKENELDRFRARIIEIKARKVNYECKLENAKRDLSYAQDKKKKAEKGKDAAIGGAIGGGVAAAVLGIIFPPSLAVTVPAVAASVSVAIVEAENEISRSNANISEAKRNIREENNRISEANVTISRVNAEISDLSSLRDDLHKRRGEMLRNIAFLQKAATFLGELTIAVKGGENRTKVLHTIVKEVNKHEKYEILKSNGCIVAANSFAAAWKEVEEQVSAGEHMSILSIDRNDSHLQQ